MTLFWFLLERKPAWDILFSAMVCLVLGLIHIYVKFVEELRGLCDVDSGTPNSVGLIRLI